MKAISTAYQKENMPVPAFDIYHLECYAFPTHYIRQLVMSGAEWSGYDWTCGRRERWIRLADAETVARWADCHQCGQSIYEGNFNKDADN